MEGPAVLSPSSHAVLGRVDGASEPVVGDVDVAKRRQDEGVMDADVVGERAFGYRDNGPSHDGHYQQTGPFPSERPQPLDAQGEDTWEHHGVEKTYQDDRNHRQPAPARHGRQYQQTGHHCHRTEDRSG